MPRNAPIVGHKMRPNNGSITAEKKEHTLKNTVMSLPDKFIVFLGRTFSGHNHDYSMLKQEFPPDGDWFSDIHVRVDLGYQGMQSDYHISVAERSLPLLNLVEMLYQPRAQLLLHRGR